MSAGDEGGNKAKGRLQKLINWVNAEQDTPAIEELESEREGYGADQSGDPGKPPDDDSSIARASLQSAPDSQDAATEDYESDNEFEYPDDVAQEKIEEVDEDYVAGDETLSTVSHEAVHLTMQQKIQMKRFRLFYLVLSAIVALNLIVILLLMVSHLPEFGAPDMPTVNEVYIRYVEQGVADTGTLNMVAAVLFSYRSFDTLGEAFVLFTAVIAVMILMQKPTDDDRKEGHKDG